MHHQMQDMLLKLVVLLLLSPGVVLARSKRKHGNPLSRSIRVMNECGVKIDLFWIHPETQQLADSHSSGDGVMYGAETGISSYVGHTFEVQEMKGRWGRCKQNPCRKAYFTVNQNEEQWVTIGPNFVVTIEDSASRAQERAQKALESCKAQDTLVEMTPEQQIDAITECLQLSIEKELKSTDEEIEFQSTVRKQMGEQLKYYTCQDVPLAPDVKTTPAVQNTTWVDYDVRILFESEYSSVRIVEEFLTSEECQSLLSLLDWPSGPVTVDQLRQGVPSIVSKLQMMMTSSFALPDDYYATTSKKPDLRWLVDEPVALSNTSNECEVQADGSCTSTSSSSTASLSSSSSASAARIVATDDESVMGRLYLQCRTDDADGGLLFFPKTGVRIQPVNGNAILILYQDLGEDPLRELDPFLDEHLTCPVTSGRAVTLEEVYYRKN